MLCPNCKKEIHDVTEKKTVIKKGWFCLIIAMAVLFVSCIMSGCDISYLDDITGVSSDESYFGDNNFANTNDKTHGTTKNADIDNSVSISKQNALKSAKSYLSFSAFSREGLIDQLEFEKYPNEDAVYAVDNCGADWYEQAMLCAKNYLKSSSFSKEGLVDQLEFEGFTSEEAKYGVDNCGADWYEQAAKTAESYLDTMSFSREGLIDQLEFEGFTYDEAVYGVNSVGL